MASELRVENYVNSFGQVIKPGEEVVYAGTAWKSTTFRKAKFGGVYYNSVTKRVKDNEGNWNYVTVVAPTAVKVYDIPCQKYDWNNVTRTGVWVDALRTAWLPLKRVFKLDMTMDQFADKEHTV